MGLKKKEVIYYLLVWYLFSIFFYILYILKESDKEYAQISYLFILHVKTINNTRLSKPIRSGRGHKFCIRFSST